MIQNARKKNNAFLIVVDPYLTKTARIADLHIKLRPGTDGALACGIMKTLFQQNAIDNMYMEEFSTGHEILKEHLNKKEKDRILKGYRGFTKKVRYSFFSEQKNSIF